MLHTYFDKVYYINLDKRVDRKQECETELLKHNIIAERVSAVDANTLTNYSLYPQRYFKRGNYGLLLTNIRIFEEAVKQGYKSIVILEDDAMFIENFNDYFEIIYPQVPEDWDILYLGANHQKPPTLVAENVGKCIETWTTHAIVFKQSSYQIILEELYRLEHPIDVAFSKLFDRVNAYSILPSIVFQRPSYSNIENKFTDYTGYIR